MPQKTKIGKMNKRILIEELDPYTEDDLGGKVNVWLPFFSESDTSEVGTTTTNIKMTNHGMLTGDYIINTSRSNAVRQITKVDTNNITVALVASQTTGDTILKRTRSKSTIWASFKEVGNVSSYLYVDSKIQDLATHDIVTRYRSDLYSSKYRFRLYPNLTRSFEIVKVTNIEEKYYYTKIKAREILL